MERRDFLAGAAILGAAAFTSSFATTAGAAGEKGTAGLMVTNEATLAAIAKLRDAAFRCDQKAAACEQHCTERLASGDTSFARCSASVQSMQAVCGAVAKLASLKSVHLGAMLDACLAACRTCKEACEEHKEHWAHGMHMECKECAEACDAVMTSVTALKGAWKN